MAEATDNVVPIRQEAVEPEPDHKPNPTPTQPTMKLVQEWDVGAPHANGMVVLRVYRRGGRMLCILGRTELASGQRYDLIHTGDEAEDAIDIRDIDPGKLVAALLSTQDSASQQRGRGLTQRLPLGGAVVDLLSGEQARVEPERPRQQQQRRGRTVPMALLHSVVNQMIEEW